MRSRLFFILAIAMLASACGSDSVEADASGFGGQWELERGTLDAAEFPLVDGYRVTFEVGDDGSISGTAACNGYGGNARIDGARLDVEEWFITEKGCEPAVMESEQAFLTVLQRSLTLVRDAEVLTMTGDGVDLTFSAIPPVRTADLVSTTWTLHTLFEGEAATQFRGEATLRLDADGTFAGSTGCRQVSGSYVLSGDEIRVTQMSAEGECSADLARQDGIVISVLESPRVEIDGDQLRLWTDGDEGLGYRSQ